MPLKFPVSVYLGEEEIPRGDWQYLVINNTNVNRNVNAVVEEAELEASAP